MLHQEYEQWKTPQFGWKINYVKTLWGDISRLTSRQTENQDRQTISWYSYQKAPSRRNNQHYSHNIRQQVPFLYSFQGHMSICDRTL